MPHYTTTTTTDDDATDQVEEVFCIPPRQPFQDNLTKPGPPTLDELLKIHIKTLFFEPYDFLTLDEN